MQKTTQMGQNRTGIQMSPIDTKKMLAEAQGAVHTPGDETGIARMRGDYAKASGPVGSVPPPGTAKGAAKSGVQALSGRKAHVLIDRLGERLAFERAGTRLYEALIAKCEAAGAGVSKQDLQQLEQFRAEEARHFNLLADSLEKLGGDPTAQTPAADVTGVESSGLMQVVTDPMTSVTQSLHAMLVAELADNDAWDELIALSRELGQTDLAGQFEEARDEERAHLNSIRQWHKEATLRESQLG